MYSDCNTVSLGSLGVLRARGTDVVPFLQGQLSNDMTRLAADHSLLAGYHNPQGRVIALLRLVQLAADDVLAVLPRELLAPVAQRLAKFILRAKVKLADESPQWTVSGLLTSGSNSPPTALPGHLDAAAHVAQGIVIRVAPQPARWLLISSLTHAPSPAVGPVVAAEVWQRLAISAGEPQVYAATSEEFVAQMLNLDALGAIAFDKGCYTGQEVIARAHYRGRVKRRMQRFLSEAAVRLGAGEGGVLADGRAFKVVDAAQQPDGRCEFLAVTTLARDAPSAAAAREAPLRAQSLELPYALPE
jgi:tRNA-modifying protein YgfZ